MAREELVNGLKNAVERGDSIESAVQSFINAGYNVNEVKEAAGQVNMGMIERMSSNSPSDTPTPNLPIPVSQSSPPSRFSFFKTKIQPTPLPLPPKKQTIEQVDNLSVSSYNSQEKISPYKPLPNYQAQQQTQMQSQTPSETQTKRKFPKILIFLIIILLLLIAGLVVFSIFGESILDAMFG